MGKGRKSRGLEFSGKLQSKSLDRFQGIRKGGRERPNWRAVLEDKMSYIERGNGVRGGKAIEVPEIRPRIFRAFERMEMWTDQE